MTNNESNGQRLTWCARKSCSTVVDLDTNPAEDRNGEVLCPDHG